MLVDTLSADSVPDDLVYFRDGARHLVVNPELGAWKVLDATELDVLRRLATGRPLPRGGDARDERVLAMLVMSWLVYLPGRRPALRQIGRAPRRERV